MTVGTPTLWAITLAAVLALIAVDFLLTRRPHEVSLREASLWSAFYIALPLSFGGWVWWRYGSDRGTEFLAGYLVEKSLSVDNLFVFMLLLAAFAVPAALQQRVLLYGIVGALVLRGVFIALGAAALDAFSATFLIFGIILAATAVKVFRDARGGHGQEVDVSRMRSVRLLRKAFPVTDDYAGPKLLVRQGTRRALTPLAVVVVAVFATDVVFAVDSVPAVYGITYDPYLVFATNAFALLGLRALYFLLAGALSRLVHLGYGLAAILALIGGKLVLHWAHTVWPSVPEIPTLLSLVLIVGILAVVTVTSLLATRDREPVPVG
ncbi:MAG TPA: TerC/Alx family metal homeostasis membrane protein [Mycobacteriales bacterium]|nr:TerC/Alx family metal homeostasis membrane protein [Mycobacteriales bacterium]